MTSELKRAAGREPASLRPKKSRRGLSFAFAGLLLAAGVGFAIVMLGDGEGEAVPVTEAAGPAVGWVDIAHPFQLYALASPQFGERPSVYEARRRPDRNEREDILAFGAFGDAAGYLRLVVDRNPGSPSETGAFFVEMARQAAGTGLAVANSKEPETPPTSFGAFDVADLKVADTRQQVSCLGFRRSGDTLGLHIQGLACGPADAPLNRAALACLIERLDLVSAGDDHDLADFFAKAQLNRSPSCAGSSLSPTPVRLTSPASDMPAAQATHAPAACGDKRARHSHSRRDANC